MTEKTDDFEAVRKVVAALEGFKKEDIERILRWSREKLGLSTETQLGKPTGEEQSKLDRSYDKPITDIKTFVDKKNPKTDLHFATAIAYYYRFEAPEDQRKQEIIGEDLQEACRQAGRERLKNPSQTLRNAHAYGLLNKGSEPGKYIINTVGENLVAMTLPVVGGTGPIIRNQSRRVKKKKRFLKAMASAKKKEIRSPKKHQLNQPRNLRNE